MTQVPKHIAIIMDGNGRWARARNLPRTAGHQRGIESCKRIVRAAGEQGVKHLTLFGFSTENWSRPADEVNELMRLLRMYLRSETAELHRSNVNMKMIGNRKPFSKDIIELIENAENLTKDNDALYLTIALNYGGRDEILEAANTMGQYFVENKIKFTKENSEEYFDQFLMTKAMPDPDILIRTSGEQRISNFLLWQSAYTEFVFTDVLWPDFNGEHLAAAIKTFSQRDRRFGKVESQ
ncbi:MAG: isoprenyl transferase [Pseudomonadota bacterium]